MSVVHFLNVKEGDCIWIKHNCGNNTVIDVSNAKTTENNQESKLENIKGNHNRKKYPVNPVEYLKDYGESNIFRFILTHPDMDHMDGIRTMFKEFSITNFWDTENKKVMNEDSDWGTYSKEDWEFYQSIRKSENSPKTLNLYAGAKGQYYNCNNEGVSGGDGLWVLAPNKSLVDESNEKGDYNDCSYVILYRTGNKKLFLLEIQLKKHGII